MVFLEELNPQLRLGITPPANTMADGKFDLVVPASKSDLVLASLTNLPNAPSSRLVAARIKNRENIAAFASRYKVSMASFLKSNSGYLPNV